MNDAIHGAPGLGYPSFRGGVSEEAAYSLELPSFDFCPCVPVDMQISTFATLRRCCDALQQGTSKPETTPPTPVQARALGMSVVEKVLSVSPGRKLVSSTS